MTLRQACLQLYSPPDSVNPLCPPDYLFLVFLMLLDLGDVPVTVLFVRLARLLLGAGQEAEHDWQEGQAVEQPEQGDHHEHLEEDPPGVVGRS